MKKKSIISKCSFLVLIGLFVSIVSHPLLHELGQIITTVLVGGRVKQITLFPQPSVLCDLTEINNNKRVIIGLSGEILPVIFAVAYTPKRFGLWYANLLMRLISVYSLCLDYVYTILFFVGLPVANTDITDILSIDRGNLYFVVVLNTLFLFFLCVSLKKTNPIPTSLKYFYSEN